MEKKAVPGTMVMLLLMSVLVLTFKTQQIKLGEAMDIGATGSTSIQTSSPTVISLILTKVPNVGEEFIVNVTITHVVNLYAWQVTVWYNALTVNYVEVFLPSDHVFAGMPSVGLLVCHYADVHEVKFGNSLLGDPPMFSGNGTLAQVKFVCVGQVSPCDLEILGPFNEVVCSNTILLSHTGPPKWETVYIPFEVRLQNDLIVCGVVPFQVIWEDKEPDGEAEALIKDKKTAVWIRIFSTFPWTVHVQIDVLYDFGRSVYTENGPGMGGVPIDPGLNEVYVPGGPAFPAFPIAWIPADTPPWLYWTDIGFDDNIRAIVDPENSIWETNEWNNEAVTGRKFVESRGLRILVLGVYFSRLGEGDFHLDLGDSADFLLGTYPIADDELEWVEARRIHNCVLEPELNEDWLYRYARIIWTAASLIGEIEGEPYDRVVVVVQDLFQFVPTPGIAIGMLRSPELRQVIYVQNGIPWGAAGIECLVAHEIGHTYYLWHPHDLGPANFLSQRYWVARRDYERWMPTFMAGGLPGMEWWIDKGRFDTDDIDQPPVWRGNLFDQFNIGPDPEVILLGGEIFKNGTVQIDPTWYRLPKGTPDLVPGTTGNYSIVLLDSQQQVLSQMGFNASFTYFLDVNGTLIEKETDVVPFMFNVPYLNMTSIVEIRNVTGHVVASRALSANAPTVRVTYPNGGEVLTVGINYTVTWEASDLDGDQLTYYVGYSSDAGKTWIPLAWDLTETNCTWNTSDLPPRSTYLVKVIAADGVNIGKDISNGTFMIVAGHDVAIINVTPSKTVVGQNYTVSINVTVQNQGAYTETFNVTAYANTTPINTTQVTLASGDSKTIPFSWNTTGFAKGNYTITAEATQLPGETDTTDNTHTDGWVIVAMVGDLTGPDGHPDGKCDMRDVYVVARAFGSHPTHPLWNPNADITGPEGFPDEKVDMRDVYLVARNFGKTDP